MQPEFNEPETEYSKKLKAYHKVSDRHVLVLEANLSEENKLTLPGISAEQL